MTSLVFLLARGAGGFGDDERAQDLIQQHRWFELRGAKPSDRFGAALVDGEVALAFNQPPQAERQLKLAVRLAKGTDQLNAARERLVVLYLRQGRMREAVKEGRAILKRDPERSDTESLLDLFGPLGFYPNFSARLPKGGSTLPCEVKPDGVRFTLAVNGKTVTWLLDSGFNFAAASESEAKALGIAIHNSGATVHDANGGEARTKTGLADRVTIGGFEFRNVPMLILPDAQPPFNDWATGRRGIVGLPLALAMQTLGWTRESVCRAGFESEAHRAQNMALDDLSLIVRASLDNKTLDLVVDTGDQAASQLWSRFKGDFPEVTTAEGVTSGTSQVTQIGGAQDRPTLDIPKLKFVLGGLEAVLKPAKVFSKPVGDDFHHGLAGMDVFSQAREVIIDFRSMTLSAR